MNLQEATKLLKDNGYAIIKEEFTDEENSIIVGVVNGRSSDHGTGARGDTEHRTDP